jgi:hypothetical protein
MKRNPNRNPLTWPLSNTNLRDLHRAIARERRAAGDLDGWNRARLAAENCRPLYVSPGVEDTHRMLVYSNRPKVA